MSVEQSSYRQIMKATSIFGGVQVFNIIISIIRSKFVAVLLGPSGMGIFSLLTSTTGLIEKFTNFGLSTSAIRNISAANTTGDERRVGTVVAVLRRLVWVTGLLGTLVTLVFSRWLSELTFGNKDYTFAFAWIAITLLLTQISAGQLVVLQGMRKLHQLAKANLAGSIVALITSVPLYYIWGVKGIVPAIITTSFMTLFFSWYFSSRIKIKHVKVTRAELFSEGGDMVKLGFFLSLSSLISMAFSYLVRIYISHKGGVDQVGLFNAGFAVINTYVGLVFTAMSTDYFPRLSGVVHEPEATGRIINQQAEVAILILAPILTVFLIFINFVVILLYSNKFLPIVNMIHWAALGIFFKAASWPVAYLIIAKGDSRLFFISELTTNIYVMGLNMLGYHWQGLEGLGISFLVGYLLYFSQVFIISRIKYSFTYKTAFYRVFSIQILLAVGCFVVSRFLSAPYTYLAGSLLILFSSYYSFRELNNRLGLLPLIQAKISKNKRPK